MSRDELIHAIRDHNRTASHEFLGGFDDPALSHYLQHLRAGRKPRGAASCWIRIPETSAIVTRGN